MKAKKYVLGNGKTYKEDYPYLQLSFFTRSTVMEVCFGDPREEEPNIAYSICKSLNAVSSSCCFLLWIVINTDVYS